MILSAAGVGGGGPRQILGVAAAILLLAALALVEDRAASRLLPRGALRPATPLGAIYMTAALLMVGTQSEIFAPYFLQVLHGQSPLSAGYLAALMAMGWTLGAMVTAGWTGRAERRVIVAGPAIGLAGLGLLAAFLPIAGMGDWRPLLPACTGLLLVGLGVGAVWPHLVSRIYRAASDEEQELAAGAITTVQLSASALGAAGAGMIVNLAGIASGVPDGASGAAFWLCVLLAAAPLLGILTARRVVVTS